MKNKENNLFNKRKTHDFRVSYKFDAPSIYHNGKYYFPRDIKRVPTGKGEEQIFIQVVFYHGKWRQDTEIIGDIDFLIELIEFSKKEGIIDKYFVNKTL